MVEPTEHPDQSTSPTIQAYRRQAEGGPIRYTPLLVCVEGPQRGNRFPLTKLENVIGRSSSVEVKVIDEMVSRRHSRIIYQNWDQPIESPRCFIEDLGSRNGTELNGETIKERRELSDHDRIVVGTTVFGFSLRDESELQLEKSLYQLATKDSLTGLDNRHQFQTYLLHHTERCRRYERPLTLLVIDVDRFKAINDRHGHDVGDEALMHAANLVAKCCRMSEPCARWGGEEFGVLLPECDYTSAMALAERIRSSVEIHPMHTTAFTIPMTVSIGGAQLEKNETPEEFFRRADQMLLRAKDAGRNRVCFDTRWDGADQTHHFGSDTLDQS